MRRMCHENREKTGAEQTLMETCIGHAETTQRRTNINSKLYCYNKTVIMYMNTVFLIVTERLVASALVAKDYS